MYQERLKISKASHREEIPSRKEFHCEWSDWSLENTESVSVTVQLQPYGPSGLVLCSDSGENK